MAASKTQLIQAAIQGSIDAFEKASSELPKGTASQDIQDDAGSNALHVASHHGHTDLVEHLVDQCGFEVNSQVDAHGKQKLHKLRNHIGLSMPHARRSLIFVS